MGTYFFFQPAADIYSQGGNRQQMQYTDSIQYLSLCIEEAEKILLLDLDCLQLPMP